MLDLLLLLYQGKYFAQLSSHIFYIDNNKYKFKYIIFLF